MNAVRLPGSHRTRHLHGISSRRKKASVSSKRPPGLPELDDEAGLEFERTNSSIRSLLRGRVTLRGKTDDLPQSWWFASTAIPLLAATIGPMANVLSIAALVTKWRVTLPNNGQLPEGADNNGVDIPDPEWELILNAISLVVGFVGNFFLLCNFTKRIRYIVALPVTIICWFFATGILTGIVVSMEVYDPPIRPGETYSQGYWYAVIASVLYMCGSMTLMVNMLGYFLGKYPQHFDLDDSQRTLILQTMMFFFWLAGGAAVFSKVCDFSYANALYFCDATVLTIGYGDFVPPNDAGRGLVFLYSIFGIIFLGLMINSIRKFATSMSKDKIVKAHQEHERSLTIGRSVSSEGELRDRLGLPPRRPVDARKQSAVDRRSSIDRYGQVKIKGRSITFYENRTALGGGRGGAGRRSGPQDDDIAAGKAVTTDEAKQHRRRRKLLLLKEEKDRFDAMRDIQQHTKRFRQYYALAMSCLAFGAVWCLGAVVFMVAERREQDMTYFQALYFCWVSLLTIGYGDFSPVSNAGKPFFVVWSLISIPIMTILISDLSETVVASINRGTFTLAEWTVMPREGVWHDFLVNHPAVQDWVERKNRQIQEKKKQKDQEKRLEQGFTIQDPDEDVPGAFDDLEMHHSPDTLATLADAKLSDHDLARKLAVAIKHVAQDIRVHPPKRYCYEEWVEFTRLIHFSAKSKKEVEVEEEEEGLVEWDWIGEDSPMLAEGTEPEWVLDRLCESLNRYTRKQAHKARMPSASASSSNIQAADQSSRHRFSHDDAHMDVQKEADEISSASSSGRDVEKDAHELALSDARVHHRPQDLEKLHRQTESEAVRAWEAELRKSRAEAAEQKEER